MLETRARVEVGPPMGAMAGRAHVWDLRELREVVIPDGVRRIGTCWFYDSLVESVTIPASVREIGSSAFLGCRNLKNVSISEGLEKIERSAFTKSGLEEVELPNTLKEIQQDVFRECGSLRVVWVEQGCLLDVSQLVGNGIEVRRK